MSEVTRRKIREPGLSLVIESDGSVEIETADGTLLPVGGEGGGPHDHDGTYEPVHAHPYASDTHDHDADYAGTSHSHLDADIPAGIARDSEVTSAIADHAATPHGGSVDFGETADIVAVAFGDTAAAGATGEVADAGHRHAAPANPVTAHEAAADPHTGYQKESEKAAASGYASLDGTTKVPIAQLPTGTTGTTVALGNAAAGLITTHEGAADPHTGYVKENDANYVDLTDGGETALHSHAGGGGGLSASQVVDLLYPVGAIYVSTLSTNPGTLLGTGTWSAFGAGRVLVGHNAGDADFDTSEETGGAKTHTHAAHTGIITHTHTTDSQGAHVHDEYRNSATTGGLDGWAAGDTSTNTPLITGYDTGSAGAHTHTANAPAGAVTEYTHDTPSSMPPYIVVYMWKRTA